ncbi:MAG TPA: hypothetical protein VEG64_14305 [Candidatus Sulfotelmatobacter sp.]|nr:hypothetical protein [Candidatus Sulfotelmatobacter sp.]
MNERSVSALVALAVIVSLSFCAAAFGGDHEKSSPVIPQIQNVAPTFVDSTVPTNGDVNPYGVAFVPDDFPRGGVLHGGDLIVSNFNNLNNLQGTGTTIVRIVNGETPATFFQGQMGLGLTTALTVLRRGFVLVGDVPSTDGSGQCVAISGPEQNVGQGGLLVINKKGKLVKTIASAKFLNGPWDMTLIDRGDHATAFVANVLSGTVTRLELKVTGDGDGDSDDRVVVERETQIASGYAIGCAGSAFVAGPTGVALDEKRDILYVSSTGDNGIFAIERASDRESDAGMGKLVVSDAKHLHGPLGLILAPNGDLISAQGDAFNPDPTQPSEIVEFTREGKFVAQVSVDPAEGGAFGLALRAHGDDFVFAAVDDNVPDIQIWVVH